MKGIFVILALIGLAYCGPLSVKHVKAIQDDILKFINNLPMDKVTALFEDYSKNDAEFQQVIAYVTGDEFQTFVNQLIATKEVNDVVEYLKEKGVITAPSHIVGVTKSLPALKSPRSSPGHRSFDQFLDDLEALIPIDEEKALFQDEMQNNPEFKNFYDTVSSEEFLALAKKVAELDLVEEQVKKLQNFGVDFNHELKIAKEIFGIPDS